MFSNYPALVLNADFAPVGLLPLSVMGWESAVHNVVADDVVVVAEHDIEIHSASLTMRLPSVIALRQYVRRRTIPALTRYNLITLRDKNCCCYCGHTFPASELTYDHFIPRAQGGSSKWQNLVASCGVCNARKSNRTPQQAGMVAQWRPWLPSSEVLARADFFLNQRKYHESWREFLPFTKAA